MSSEPVSDAQACYEAARARYEQIVEEWTGLGCPLMAEGSTGQLVEHPLVKMQREHERLMNELDGKARHRGRRNRRWRGFGGRRVRS